MILKITIPLVLFTLTAQAEPAQDSKMPGVVLYSQLATEGVFSNAVLSYMENKGMIDSTPPKVEWKFGLGQLRWTAAENALGSTKMSEDWYVEYLKLVHDCVREELKAPGRLESNYKRFKPIMVKYLSTTKLGTKIKVLLREVIIPTFKKPITKDLLAQHHTVSLAYARNRTSRGKYIEDFVTAKLRFNKVATIYGFQDPEALQFRIRRHDEGGDELVEMWLKILTDLEKSF